MKSRKRLGIYPGTFDPITNGHLDILKRASALFDHVILAIAKDSSKSTIFSLDERLSLIQEVIKSTKFHSTISVECFSGLLVNFAKHKKANNVVRGLRAISDFEYEFQMALMNRHQAPNVETLFLMPDEKYVYLSSSIVRELAFLKGDLSALLPAPVLRAVRKKFNKN